MNLIPSSNVLSNVVQILALNLLPELWLAHIIPFNTKLFIQQALFKQNIAHEVKVLYEVAHQKCIIQHVPKKVITSRKAFQIEVFLEYF